MATLEFLTGKLAGTTIDLSQEPRQIVGMSRKAGVRLRDRGVSWDHAAIIFEDGAYAVEDLGSKGGTTLNGETISAKTALNEGDKLVFGPTECVFKAGAPAAAVSAATPAPAAAAVASEPAAAKEAKKAAATAGTDDDGKRLSVRERLALRRQERSSTSEAAGKAKGKDLDDGDVRDKLRSAEIDLRKAVRDLKKNEGELAKATEELEAIKAGTAAEQLEQELVDAKTQLAERDVQIENLNLALKEAHAGVGTLVTGDDTQVQDPKMLAQLEETEAETRRLKGVVQKQLNLLKRRNDEVERLKAKASGDAAATGFSGADEENEMLRGALEDKNVEVDNLSAELLETRELIETLQGKLTRINAQEEGRKSNAERRLESLENKIGEYVEQKHHAEKELAKFKKDYEDFEERVLALQAQCDDLTERNDIYAYRLEQADTKVGELVREKIADMQEMHDEIVQTNVQLTSLIQAYEEKIDEMDSRIEELEAETTELEQLLTEEREGHEETRATAEREQRKLRKRLQLAIDELGTTQQVAANTAG